MSEVQGSSPGLWDSISTAKNGEGVEGLPQISVQWPAGSSSVLDSQNPAGGRTEGKEKVLEEGPLNDRA